MAEAPSRFPLCWPDTIPRKNGGREAGSFKTGLPQALKNVEGSLRRFGQLSGRGTKDVIISSNVTLGHEKPADPGVAVWFTWEDQLICIPVDRYSSVEANVQAIHHVLEARCTELRHGTLALVRATMKSLIALPAPKSWREILGFRPDQTGITADMVTAAHRAAARLAGPESARLYDLNMARDRAHKELSL